MNPPSDLDEVHVLDERAVELLDSGDGRAVPACDGGERVTTLNRVPGGSGFLRSQSEFFVNPHLHDAVIVSGSGSGDSCGRSHCSISRR